MLVILMMLAYSIGTWSEAEDTIPSIEGVFDSLFKCLILSSIVFQFLFTVNLFHEINHYRHHNHYW